MKLGIKIQIISQGISEFPGYNTEGNWTQQTVDVRDVLKRSFYTANELSINSAIQGGPFDGSGHVVYVLKYIGQDGYLIGVVKAVSANNGRPYDGTVAWVHFPLEVDISGAEAFAVLHKVKEAISDPMEIDRILLAEVANKEYRHKDAYQIPLTSNKSGDVGVILYGDPDSYVSYNSRIFPLNRYLGEFVYQTEYSNYKAVILANIALGLAVNPAATQLSGEPKKCSTIFEPVKDRDAFVPKVTEKGGTQEYALPLLLPPGKELVVVWHRDGWKDITEPIYSNTGIVPLPDEAKKCRIFSTNRFFRIVSEFNEPINIKSAQIYVDGQRIGEDSFTLSALKMKDPVRVTVEVPGYEKEESNITISRNTKEVDIKLKKRSHLYKFIIPAVDDSGKPAYYDSGSRIVVEATLESPMPIEKCPIKGYESENGFIDEASGKNARYNRLRYAGDKSLSSVLRYLIIGAVGGIIFALIIIAPCLWGYLKYCGIDDPWTYIVNPVSSPDRTPFVHVDDDNSGESEPPSESDTKSENPGQDTTGDETDSVGGTADSIPQPEGEYVALVNYLKTENKWKRSDLADISHGVEFYDVLNDGDRMAELQEWCYRLSPDVEKVREIQTLLNDKFGSSDWSGKRIVFSDGNNNIYCDDGEITPLGRYKTAIEQKRLIGNELKSPVVPNDSEQPRNTTPTSSKRGNGIRG